MRGCKKEKEAVESAASNQELFVTNGTGIKTNTQKYYIKTFPTCRKRGKLNFVFFLISRQNAILVGIVAFWEMQSFQFWFFMF